MGLFQKITKKLTGEGWKEFSAELKWLWQYTCRYRNAIGLYILLGVAGIVMGLGSSVASKYLIDAVTGYKTGAISTAAAIMVGMMVGNIVIKCISSRISATINVKVQNEIQAEVYNRILNTDWESLRQFRSGDLLNRLDNDTSTISGGVIGFFPSLISHGVQFVGAFLIIFYYDYTMALIALAGVPVSVLCSRVLVRRMRRHNREMKEIYSDVMSFHEDSLQNLTSIKAFGIMDLFLDKMSLLQDRYRDAYLDYNKFSVRTSALMSVMGMVVTSSCFAWGVYRLWTGAISYGSMTMFLQLASSLTGAFSSLVGLASTAISMSTSAGRIMAVVELPAEEPERDDAFEQESRYTLQLSNVGFTYQDGERVLYNVEFTAAPGDLVALSGPSGEGKTTMLRIILGLVQPQQGRAELIGSSGNAYSISAGTRHAFGYVPQGNSLFAGTIADNLRMTRPEATDEELKEVLRIACAYDFVMELPGGMNYMVGGRGKGISEGQAQRIAVARALLRKAPILLLDEATSALDEETERNMLHNLMTSDLVQTCILVTHRSSSKQFCSRSVCIRDGRVCEENGEYNGAGCS